MSTKVQKQSHGEKVADDPAAQDLVETPANDTGHDSTDTSQTDDLRAYAPAGAAMAQVAPQDEEGYHEDEGYEDESFEAEDGSGSIADAMRDNFEKDFVDETVDKINSMYRKNVDNGKIEIGTYLLDKMFNGNAELAMSTNPQKHETFSKIIERTDLLVEPKTLGSWVRAAAAMRAFTNQGIKLPSLTTYHYVELAAVRDKKKRIEFAKQAEFEELTVKDLREAIRKGNGKTKTEAQKFKDEMDKGVRQYAEISVEDKLNEFVCDAESVKIVYPPQKAMQILPEVKKCLSNVRAQQKLFEEFHGSLRSIVEEAMEPLSD